MGVEREQSSLSHLSSRSERILPQEVLNARPCKKVFDETWKQTITAERRYNTMASCKFEKGKYHTATEAKAHFRHDDISIESRKIAAKSNPNIDVTKSHLNRSLLGLTYQQMCERYDKRISELDATTNTNKRKDRVTLQNIEVPVPAELERENYNRWFVRVAEILCDMYGRKNFVDGQIHWDEEHQYVSVETGELVTSRVHSHFSIIPEVNGVLNCKKLSGRNNMIKLNKAVEDMTQKEFGCSFMTGEKKKSCYTINELKNISGRLELEKRANAVVEAENRLLQSKQDIEQKMAYVGEFERFRALESKRLEAENHNSRLLEQQAKSKLQEAEELYNKSKELHNKLMNMSDIFTEQYADDFAHELGYIKKSVKKSLSL